MTARDVLAGMRDRAVNAEAYYSREWVTAAARLDVPRLVAAVEAVLEAHRPHNAGTECWRCGQPWPCQDFRDITAALEGWQPCPACGRREPHEHTFAEMGTQP